MSDNTITSILSTIITSTGILSTLLLTIIVALSTRLRHREDELREKLTQYELEIEKLKKEKQPFLDTTIQKVRTKIYLEQLPKFPHRIFYLIYFTVFIFSISLIFISLKHLIVSHFVVKGVYILVSLTIVDFGLLIPIIWLVIRYYDLVVEDFVKLNHVFYNGYIWKILLEIKTGNIIALNTLTKDEVIAYRDCESENDAYARAKKIIENPKEFLENGQ